ncbi:replicative DNA helicase [Ammonifex thiophilus]|uniref:Replicative DNA helicase n=1 Tax=Ammonifex thiophilus TaxID=444093 RepID=A0A3D8P5H3_9THEO|nr:replicative DNA helicase [Ammonifex thiophilus]RDV84593.1 replicative DNA helicase [Ammonifex thiophilus]
MAQLPQNVSAEQALLGSIFLDPETLSRVEELVRPEDFYEEAHRAIYEAMLELEEKSLPIDLITVTEHLRREGKLEKAGGAAYVASLVDVVPTAAHAEHYAKLVRDKALLRSLVEVATRIRDLGLEEAGDARQLLSEAERWLAELSAAEVESSFVALSEVLEAVLQHLEESYRYRGKKLGLPTGFEELDGLLSGLWPQDLIILASRPGMGKTSLALSISLNVAREVALPVGFFSLEMSREQLIQRLLAAEARVDHRRVRTAEFTDEDWVRLSQAAARLAPLPLYIDDTPGLSVRDLRARARRLKAQAGGLGLVVVDYLQLVQPPRRMENRQQEIAFVSRSLKHLAKELNCPVLALSQLSRAPETRQDKRPQLSDLRESGSLEQDADVVMFIYREDYYRPDTDKPGVAEIIVAKQRNGPTGTAELAFLREYTCFVTLAKDFDF